jgi:MoaA/NifB/PqqE/SkfB family radical SAM enzyme
VTPSDVRLLQIEPTSHCNAKCPHCPRFDCIEHDVFESTGTLHPDLNLSHIDVDHVIENLQLDRLTSLKKVVLEGDKGDPAMHPQIEKLIEVFSSMKNPPLISMTTNGSIRSNTWWAELAKKRYPNLKVIFSIDGLADTNHLYRVGIDFEKIINNARAFIDAGGYAVWKLIVFKHNQHQVDEIHTLSQNMGFSEYWVRSADDGRFKGLDKWPVITEQGTHYLEVNTKNYKKFDQEHIFKHPVIPNRPQLSNATNRLCPNLVKGQLYITHENYVIPCCMMHFVTEQNYFGRDEFLKLAGDLKQHDLSAITLETILNNKFFSESLLNSLKDNNWHYSCANSCGPQINENIKKLEIL